MVSNVKNLRSKLTYIYTHTQKKKTYVKQTHTKKPCKKWSSKVPFGYRN